MADYSEVVQFEWHLDGPQGPDAASAKMNAALDGIDSRITAIGTNANSTFGASFQSSLSPALASVGELNTALRTTLDYLKQIKEVGPINPFGDRGSAPTPNNPDQPSSGGGGDILGTVGDFTFYRTATVRNRAGRYASPQDAFAPPPPQPEVPPPSNSSFSGDMFPATEPSRSEYLRAKMASIDDALRNSARISTSPNDIGQSRLNLNQPGFLGGGFSYDAPQEFDTTGWLSANVYNKPELRNWGTGGAPSDQRIGDKWYSKPMLGNLGVLGENDPRYVSQSIGNAPGVFGISPGENDRLNALQDPNDQPEWLRKLLNQPTQPSQALVPTIDLYRGLGFGKQPDPNSTNQWWSANPNTAVDYNSVGQSNYGRADQSLQATVLRATADFNLLIDKSMSDYTESNPQTQAIFRRQGMDYDFGGKPNIGASEQMSIGDIARVSSNYKEMLQSATNLPTDQIKATFGYINDATPGIVQLGAAFQNIGQYSKPLLTNFGVEGAPTNARIGDQWSNGLSNFGNSYSDLQGQANSLSSITDLLQQFAKLRYGGPARDGLLGNEVGFPVETGWTSTIYGGGTRLGGLLNGPQPEVIPGQGSAFGIPNWQTPPQQTIGANPYSYSYNSTNGFYSFGQQDSGPMGSSDFGRGQGAYQYQPPPPPGSSATYGPGGFGTPGSPFSFGSGTVFPGAGNPNGFGMAGGLWGPGAGGPAGPPGPPWVGGGWQQGNQNPNFNPATLNMAGNINNVGVSFQNATTQASNFERALGRIVTYTVIFAGFAAIGSVIKGVADEMVRLSDVQARVGFINGQSIQSTESQFTSAANYGISPDQAGKGILTAAQLGASPQQNQQAQQLAMIFGADQYSSALIQLSRTQDQASATGLKYVNTLDFIAQSTKTYAGGTLNDYFTALQKGIELNAQFGVSAEAMGLAIEKAAVATGESPAQLQVSYQSILSKLATPATQKALEPLGIQRGDANTMVREVATEYERLAAIGDRAGIQKLGEALQGGGIGGYSRIGDLPVIFQALSQGLDDVNPKLAKFNDLLSSASDSDVTKINALTASWNNFLLALGTGVPGNLVEGWLTAMTGKLKGFTDIIENGGQFLPSVFGDTAGAAKRVQKYEQDNPFGPGDFVKTILDPFTIVTRLAGILDAARNNQDGGYNEGGRPGPAPLGSSGVVSGFGLRIPQSILNPYPNPMENFGGLQTMPQQVSMQEYIKMIQQQETQLKIAGVPTDDKNYEILSHSGELLGQMLVDSNAIRLTNEKIAQNTSTFGGAPPAGVTAANAAEFQAKVTAEDAKLKAAGITTSDPKTIVFQDKATDALFSIKGTNEAIQFATQQTAAHTASFAGTLPKGEDIAKIQARISALDSSGMIAKAGLDTTETQKVFWDPVTQTLKSIHGTETAIQIATEEAAKLLQQQITGTFNVPAGGEAVVAFFALQQGFVPAGTPGSGNGAAALNGSAGALSGSAYQLTSAAAALIAAANAMGGPNGDILRGIAAHEAPLSPSSSARGVAGYVNVHQGFSPGGINGPGSYDRGADRSQPISYPALPQSNIHGQFERGGVSTGPRLSEDDQLYQLFHQRFKSMVDSLVGRYPNGNITERERVPSGPTGVSSRSPGSSPTNINVSNAIRINIDGRQIAYQMNRKTYRQFESVRNSVSGVPNSVVTL